MSKNEKPTFKLEWKKLRRRFGWDGNRERAVIKNANNGESVKIDISGNDVGDPKYYALITIKSKGCLFDGYLERDFRNINAAKMAAEKFIINLNSNLDMVFSSIYELRNKNEQP